MKPKVHFESIRRLKGFTITGTLCNRMVADGNINSSPRRHEVTCKVCLRLLVEVKQERAA